jgi:putative transcriptional regulator
LSARERLDPDLLALDPEAAAPEPRPGLRASLLASVADESGLAGFGPRFAAFFDLAGARALELLRIAAGSAGAAGGWVTLPPLAGVELLHFAGGARVARHDCGLVRIAPGVRFPEHTHTGDEWSFVVSGTAEEEGSGALWAPGDVVYRPAGSAHAFRVTSREPLVFGVVLEGGIEIREQQP